MIQQPTEQPYADPLGSLVKHVREHELQLSQGDLAWLAGVSRGTISNLETGRVNPDRRTWHRIRTALALPPMPSNQVSDGNGVRLLFPADAVQGVIGAILAIRDQDPDAGLRIAERWRRLVLRSSREGSQPWPTTNPELSWLAQELVNEAPPGMAPLLHAAVQGRTAALAPAAPHVPATRSPAVSAGLDQVQELATTVSDLARQLSARDDRAQGFDRLPAPVQDLVAHGLVVSYDVTSPEPAPGVALIQLVVMNEGESSLAARQEAHDAARRWSTILSVAAHIIEKEAPDLAPEDIIAALKAGAQAPAAVKELLPQARSGDPLAMYKLARQLQKHGRMEEAELWLHRAAGVGHPGALFTLGNLAYEDGRRSEAERWWRDAAEAEHPDAMYSLWALLCGEHPQAAERWLRQAAAAGNRNAMYRLWQLNRGVSSSEAEEWLREAANHGHIEAITDLSKLVAERGREDEAVRLMRRAAEDGDTGTFTVYEVMLYERRMRERAGARHG